MKRIIPILLSAALLLALAACGTAPAETTPPVSPDSTPSAEATPSPAATPAPGQFVFTRENFPRMDGSTSMVPLAEAVASVLLGESREAVSDLVHFNRTSQSFRNLMDGNCDILLAGDPAESVWEECREQGFAYERAHIATDALIFVVSADNPVDSLTTEQIRKIYTGEITNWSQLDGDDVAILPFQRNAEAGSQAAMERLVMDGLEMMDPPTEQVIDSMSGLMDAVRSFDGSEGAIGYSVYYYANDMRMAEGLKILRVDDVEPEPETIRSGQYPFLAKLWAVIAADEPEDSPARILYEWLVSADGKRLMKEQGYVYTSVY